jgi:hypothetical protein
MVLLAKLSLERVVRTPQRRDFGVRSNDGSYPGRDNCPGEECPEKGALLCERNCSGRGMQNRYAKSKTRKNS